jgi:hypothetical protein
MSLVVITCHDTDHGLEVSAVWDKPVNPNYLKSQALAKKHLTPAQDAAFAMLTMMEKYMQDPKIVMPENSDRKFVDEPKPLIVGTDIDAL